MLHALRKPTTPVCGPRAAVNVIIVTTLAERLGHAPDTKLVILSCDDLGASHASNVGVFRALHDGAATCASLMVPAPWACHAANNVTATDDIGVHLDTGCSWKVSVDRGGKDPRCSGTI